MSEGVWVDRFVCQGREGKWGGGGGVIECMRCCDGVR